MANNTCHERAVTDELSGALTSFQTTYLERLVNDTANFMSNDTNRDLIERITKEVEKVTYAYNKAQNIKEPLGDLLGKSCGNVICNQTWKFGGIVLRRRLTVLFEPYKLGKDMEQSFLWISWCWVQSLLVMSLISSD